MLQWFCSFEFWIICHFPQSIYTCTLKTRPRLGVTCLILISPLEKQEFISGLIATLNIIPSQCIRNSYCVRGRKSLFLSQIQVNTYLLKITFSSVVLVSFGGPCDPECSEVGCDGPGPDHCNDCLHYYYKLKNNTR